MPTKFFTNQQNNSLLKKFEGIFTHIESIRYFDALVGYFRASGYFKLRPFLDKIPQIRILVGINVDQLTKNYHDKGQLYIANPDKTKESFVKDIITDIQDAHYDKSTEIGILQFIQDIVEQKIELRAHPTQKIHAKVYIMRPQNFNEHAPCEVITGSSNLTDSGLGTYEKANYEFNVSLRDYDDVKFATDEFERLWLESVPILNAEMQLIKQGSFIRDFTPYELYIKMLASYFGRRVEYDPYNIDLLLPDKFMRLKYQSDAANQGYAIMMKHHGFILADVVGLGKTIIACMVIKKFIYENGTHTRILLVVPPAIEGAWRKTIEEFQLKQHFDLITLGSLDKVQDLENHAFAAPDRYDLIVVDESHKFRNDHTDMYTKLQKICKTPRARPAENGDIKKKVILMSATPLNNCPQDIENQLYLFQDKRNSTLEGVRNLQEYFKSKNKLYDELAKEAILDVERLKTLFNEIRQDVIEPLVIRRTRTDIAKNPEHMEDLKTQNIKFPTVQDPIPIYYKLDPALSKLFADTIDLIAPMDDTGNPMENGIGYYRYRAIEYLQSDENRKIYGNVMGISNRLSAIMRTLLVKRLESSFHAFKQSLMRLQKSIDNMIEMFEKNTIFIAPDFDINKLLEDGFSFEEIEAKISDRKGNNHKFKRADFNKDFLELLKSDKQKVDFLTERWTIMRADPKLNEFMRKVRRGFFDKTKNLSGKLVIFTESKETADTLTDAVVNNGYKVLTISSKNRKEMEPVIRDNFDANHPEDKWKHDYDIIITTEVLAEGINLHRSNVIVNYDVPWNATRLMQRIGRVNRIGSRADEILVYNFYPSSEGDTYIQLINKALRKLQAFHTAFGEDNRIFSLLEEVGDGALYGSNIKHEENEILTYLTELRLFKKNHPKWFTAIEKMPYKSRCGREVRALQMGNVPLNDFNYPLRLTSLTYLKSENHPGIFCLITPELNTLELGFLQVVKIFKAETTEKSIPLHELHHEQALKALDFFENAKIQDRLQPVSRKNLSPVENKALANLNGFIKIAATEQKRNTLRRAMDKIKEGVYAAKGLPKEINDFCNASKTGFKPDLLETFFAQILDKYDFSGIETLSKMEDLPMNIINPKIVLTVSFN